MEAKNTQLQHKNGQIQQHDAELQERAAQISRQQRELKTLRVRSRVKKKTIFLIVLLILRIYVKMGFQVNIYQKQSTCRRTKTHSDPCCQPQ